jgi:hypothetical protein
LDFPIGLRPSGFPTKLLYAPFLALMRATCPVHLSSWLDHPNDTSGGVRSMKRLVMYSSVLPVSRKCHTKININSETPWHLITLLVRAVPKIVLTRPKITISCTKSNLEDQWHINCSACSWIVGQLVFRIWYSLRSASWILMLTIVILWRENFEPNFTTQFQMKLPTTVVWRTIIKLSWLG